MSHPLPFDHTLPSNEPCFTCGYAMRYIGPWLGADELHYNQVYYCYRCAEYHFYDLDGQATDPHLLAVAITIWGVDT